MSDFTEEKIEVMSGNTAWPTTSPSHWLELNVTGFIISTVESAVLGDKEWVMWAIQILCENGEWAMLEGESVLGRDKARQCIIDWFKQNTK